MKEFSCKQECGSNCCSFVVVDSLFLNDNNVDHDYADLHGIEFKEVLLENGLKHVYFKIPLKCDWLNGNKCVNYENRPNICRVNNAGDHPFKVENCPY